VESQTYHFHFRQYDVKVGVWTTPDPIGILGGLNVYSYVENNPVNRLDLLGLHTGGYGGPEKGDEMADGSAAEGPGSMNDSHSSFYDGVSVADLENLVRNGNYWNGHATAQNIPSLDDLESLSKFDVAEDSNKFYYISIGTIKIVILANKTGIKIAGAGTSVKAAIDAYFSLKDLKKDSTEIGRSIEDCMDN